MPRGDHNFSGSFGGGKRYSSLSAEEAAGIGILVVVLAVLVIIGWWYYKKRSGYKSIMVPEAPPAYEKISANPLPPPYAP